MKREKVDNYEKRQIGVMTCNGESSIFEPKIHPELKPMLRIIFKEERNEARKRLSTIGGYHYKPSDEYVRRKQELVNKRIIGRK